MTKEEARNAVKVFSALAEGKSIEYRMKAEGCEWLERNVFDVWDFATYEYRVKPQPKIRPFANAKECWSKMMEHPPFGWVKEAKNNYYCQITDVDDDGVCLREELISYKELLSSYRFINGFVDDDYLGVEE